MKWIGLSLIGFALFLYFAPRASKAAESPDRYALTRCDLGKPCVWTMRFGHSQDCLDEVVRQTRTAPTGTVLGCAVIRVREGRR
jgi:hypothetical protein